MNMIPDNSKVTIIRSERVSDQPGFVLTENIQTATCVLKFLRTVHPGEVLYAVECVIGDMHMRGGVFMTVNQTLEEATFLCLGTMRNMVNSKIVFFPETHRCN